MNIFLSELKDERFALWGKFLNFFFLLNAVSGFYIICNVPNISVETNLKIYEAI